MIRQQSVDQRLRESEIRLTIALTAAQIGIWDWNLATNEMEYSARARSIFGFPRDRPLSLAMVRDATHPDDLPRTHELSRIATDPEVRAKPTYEYRIIRADNQEVRWVLAHGEAMFQRVDGETRAVRYLGTIQDITERKRTETALAESELTQRLALAAARMALWSADLVKHEVQTSPAVNAMFGLPEDASPTIEEFGACYMPGEQERVRQAGREAVEAGESQFEVVFRVRRPEGGFRWLLLRAEVIFSDDRIPKKVVGVLMDVDERKRNAERQALLARELNHRVKNSLTVVQSLATQTFRGLEGGEERLRTFQGRLMALAKANNVLLDRDWKHFGLRALLDEIVGPYRDSEDDPIFMEGDDFDIPPATSVPLALALHELCTNAAKYGALSDGRGRVGIRWARIADRLQLEWVESGGPRPTRPDELGFGTRLLTQILAPQLGEVDLRFLSSGLECRFLIPITG